MSTDPVCTWNTREYRVLCGTDTWVLRDGAVYPTLDRERGACACSSGLWVRRPLVQKG